MSFLRHAEIYRSDVGCQTKSRGRGAASRWSVPGPAKGRDGRTAPYPSSTMSFRTGYSLAGCSPAEPTSASPVATSMHGGRNAGNDLSANGNLSLISVSQRRGAVQTVTSFTPLSPKLIDVARFGMLRFLWTVRPLPPTALTTGSPSFTAPRTLHEHPLPV